MIHEKIVILDFGSQNYTTYRATNQRIKHILRDRSLQLKFPFDDDNVKRCILSGSPFR
jgi:hypothetical protein